GAGRGAAPDRARRAARAVAGRRTAPPRLLGGADHRGVPRQRDCRERRGSGVQDQRMSLAVVGISHRTAPVEVRERLAYTRAAVPRALQRLLGSGAASEAVLLSACNRTELYVTADELAEAEAAVGTMLEEQWPGPEPLSRFLYRRRGRAVVDHLF